MQTHHMINSQLPGKLHMVMQIVADMAITFVAEAFRMLRRESPVLAFGKHHVGRGTNVGTIRIHMLTTPNVVTIRSDAKRQIEI